MTVHDTVHGFIVEREVPLPELDAVMYQMKHEKTGLELVWISREEENKVFGIGFETLPWNDTGVFHILEHSGIRPFIRWQAEMIRILSI